MSLNVVTQCRAVFVLVKICFWKFYVVEPKYEGFQFLVILELWCISFHAMVVFGLGKDLLFKWVLVHCASETKEAKTMWFLKYWFLHTLFSWYPMHESCDWFSVIWKIHFRIYLIFMKTTKKLFLKEKCSNWPSKKLWMKY